MKEILLIDLSAVFARNYHATSEEDASAAKRLTVQRIHELAQGHDFVAVCCDAPGKTFRHEIFPDYKANRDKKPTAYFEEIQRTCERLAADGLLLWRCDGVEADDVIATAVVRAIVDDESKEIRNDVRVTIATADKDLMQLVGENVRIHNIATNEIFDAAKVREKLGVNPELVAEYLALTGDTSDNIPGIKGVGPKNASALLNHFGTLRKIYDAACIAASSDASKLSPEDAALLKPSISANIKEGKEIIRTAIKLTRLKTDAPINFETIYEKRAVKAITASEADSMRHINADLEEQLARAEQEIVIPEAIDVPEFDAAESHQQQSAPAAVTGTVAIRAPQGITRTVAQVVATMIDLKVIRTFVASQLKEGLDKDYGTIPGTSGKKTLLLPGAQKTGAFFNVRPTYDIQRYDMGSGHVEYVITCHLISRDCDAEVSSGVGSCSSMETKYRYRTGEAVATDRPVPKEYWDSKNPKLLGGKGFTPKKVDGRWFIAEKSGERVENENIHDIRNTVLKMSKKRAYVDSMIALGCMSELFTQDFGEVFDIDGEIVE